jgi:hypothetical protein
MRQNAKQNNASKRHDRSTDAPLYPDEAEIARLGERAQEWPGKVAVLERDGLPKIDPLMRGGFWPAVRQGLLDRHGPMGQLPGGETLPAKSRVRIVPSTPDGEVEFDGEKAQAARCQRRDRRILMRQVCRSRKDPMVKFINIGSPPKRHALGYLPRTVRLHCDLTTLEGPLELLSSSTGARCLRDVEDRNQGSV